MSRLELCPACLRLAHDLVEEALDFTAMVRRGEMPRLCAQHVPLVFSSLGYPTMARWLNHVLALRDADSVAFEAMPCPLCSVEQRFTLTREEQASAFLCPDHGGGRADVLALIRHHLGRIADGEHGDQRRFVIRAAVMFYVSVRGTPPFVRIE